MEIGVSNIVMVNEETNEESNFSVQNVAALYLQPSQTKKHLRYKNLNDVSMKLKDSEGLDYLRELVRKEQIMICIKTAFQYFIEAGSIKELLKPKHLYIKVGRGNQKGFL